MQATTTPPHRPPSGRRRRSWTASLLLALLGAAAGWESPPGLPNPAVARLSPPGESYVDPEVLQIGAKLVFQTNGGEIWLADLDPATGLFLSDDGRDELVDTGASPIAVTWSGPELGVDASGWSVLYAKATTPGGPPQIWRAERSDGGWSAEPLTGGDPHQTQLATSSLIRTGTRILNIRGTWSEGTIAWFSEHDPTAEHPVIVIDEDTFGRTPARWSRDGRFVLHRDELARIRMADADLGTHRLIVDDGSTHDDPNAWPAPELGGELLVATVADDTTIAIFRDLGGPTWTRIATLEVPDGSDHVYCGSPEPLVVDGRSYLSLVVKNRPNHSDVSPTDSEVWVVGIEPGPGGAPRVAWRCDDGAPGVFRSDPETFVGSDEVFVYYSVIDRDGGGGFYELWRARTGIPVSGRPRPEVETGHGRVRGIAHDGADAFRGLPYAAPPVGVNRWRPPQPVPPWDGVRDAAFFGSPAPQTLATRVGGDARPIGDEDCLFLNVWTRSEIDGFTSELLDELGFTGSEPDLLERLRAVPPEVFATARAAQFTGLGVMRFGPHVDRFVLDDQPYNLIHRGEHARVPFVVGSNSAEYAHRFADIPDAAYRDMILASFGQAVGAQVLDEYPLSDFGSAGAALDAVHTDKNLTCFVRRTAAWVASNQSAAVYRYWFDHTLSSPLRLGDGAYHTSELLLLFQHVSAGHLDGDGPPCGRTPRRRDRRPALAARPRRRRRPCGRRHRHRRLGRLLLGDARDRSVGERPAAPPHRRPGAVSRADQSSTAVARPSRRMKPAMSVKVVTNTDDATAGSAPTWSRRIGTKAPANEATIRLPHIATRTTRPKVASPFHSRPIPPTVSPSAAPLTIPTSSSLPATRHRPGTGPLSSAIRRIVTASAWVPAFPPRAAMIGMMAARITSWSMVPWK